MVNLEWYRSFVATYQTGTVTAAAQQRFLTQPTLSQHIAALENALKTSLFERTARRMIPTDAAQSLYPKVIVSIERLEAIEHSPLDQNDTPWLRIGTPITYFYEQVIDKFAHSNINNTRLQVRLGETKQLIDKLKNNDLDLVFATQKISMPRIHYTFIQNETFHLVLPKSLNIDLPDQINLDDLSDWLTQQDWISYSPEMPIIRRFWQSIFKKRPDFEPKLIIPDLHTILHSIELGLGISILPNYLLTGSHSSPHIHIPWKSETDVNNALYIACSQDRLREPLIAMALSIFTNQ